MANLTRINNNQITDAISGNVYTGINANTKVQQYSITSSLLANNLTYNSDLTVNGNLSVNGNVTAIDTTNVTIEDPLLLLASTQTGTPSVDIGYIGQRGTSNNVASVWDESSLAFVTVYTNSGAGDNTVVNILSYADFITGNANVTGALTAASISLGGNVVGNLNVTGAVNAGDFNTGGAISATGNITANYYFGNGSQLTGIVTSVSNISNGTSYANISVANGNLDITINGNSTAVFYDTGLSVNGNITTTNSLNGANLSLSGNVDSALNVTTQINSATLTASGNVTAANFSTSGVNGNITGANVISAVTLTATGAVYSNNIISAVGNIYGDNISAVGTITTIGTITGGSISTTGNVNGNVGIFTNLYTNAYQPNAVAYYDTNGFLIADTAFTYITGTQTLSAGNLAATTLSLAGNVISTLNVTGNIVANDIYSTVNLSAGGNIVGNNLSSTNNISATGTITGGFIQTANTVSASGNIITNSTFVGNSLYGDSLVITSTAGGLQFSVTGNINAGNTYITNVPEPIANSDVANKAYVDGIANGLQVKASVSTATVSNIATATGSTYVYNNGTAGVGATITLTNTGAITIDGVALTLGMRVLIKDEPLIAPTDGTTPSAAYNGIYEVTTAGATGVALVLTRTTDDDQPGQMYSAYTFVTSPIGSTNSSSGWASTNTPTNPGPITVGTTYYIFVQFSQAGSYSAGNALSLTGSTFNTLTDGTTIAVNGSNQLHIPANAVLTTPNIGAATGTSLSVTGAVTGNTSTFATSSVTGDVYANNVYTTNNVSAGGNVTVGSVAGTHTLSVYGDITTTTAGGLTGNINASGYVSAAGNITTTNYIFAGQQISAQGNIISAGHLLAANLSLSGNVDSTLNVTGNVNANNISATNTISAAGNVYAANFATTGPTGNITGANIISATTLTATANVYAGSYLVGDGYYISNINAANVASTKISNGNSYANIATPDGNINLAVNTVSVGAFYNSGLSLTGDLISSNVSATGNIATTGRVVVSSGTDVVQLTSGVITATGNITGGNINTGGNVNATSAFVNAGAVLATGRVEAGTTMSAAGNIVGPNVTISGNSIISNAGILNINTGTAADFAVNTGTPNVLYVNSTYNSVSVGSGVQTVGATFAINATDSMLLPIGNTLQRPTGATGMLRWNTTLSEVEVFNGVAWTGIGSGSYTVIQNEQFDGDGSTVAFVLGSSQTTDSCIVTINGVVQAPTTAYSVSGVFPTCVLTFTEAPQVGDTIDVREITSTTTVTAISNTTGNSVVSIQETTGQVDITGNLVAQLNASAPSLTANSTMSFQLLSNTSLAILVRGTDGVTRSTTLTLS